MTTDELEQLFDKHEDEFLEDDRLTNRTFSRTDLHAFALLDRLVPYVPGEGGDDIVSRARHDEVFLGVSPEQLAAVVTEEQVVELIRCGVRYDRSNDALAMFV